MILSVFLLSRLRRPSKSSLFPYTTLFRSVQLRRSSGKHARGSGWQQGSGGGTQGHRGTVPRFQRQGDRPHQRSHTTDHRSEEHTSELQSRENLVCRPLLEKKNEGGDCRDQ